APRRNVAEEAQSIRLVAPFLVPTGERQRPLGKGLRVLQAVGQQLRLPQEETTAHLDVYSFYRCRLFHRLCEQWHGGGDTPAQGIRRTQGRSHQGEIDREACVLTEAHSPFEPGERPGQIALAETQLTTPPQGKHEARGVRNRLGNLESFFREG